MNKIFLTATVAGAIVTNAFGAASLRAPQIGGTATVTTPTATTNTARAGTLRTQTLKSTSVSTPLVTTTSVATPTQSESVESRMALSKGFKNFNPQQVKDKAAAQQELDNIDARIEELQSKLDAAEANAENSLGVVDVERVITSKIESGNLVSLEQLQQIRDEIPSFNNEILNMYYKTIDGTQYSCGTWQVNLTDWEDVVSMFIRPTLCKINNLTFGRDCILDGDPINLTESVSNHSETPFYKWRFNLCRLDQTTPHIPEFQTYLVNQYYTVQSGKDLSCYTWRTTLADWNEVVSRFIIPDICTANNLTYSEDCNVINHGPMSGMGSIWKTQFTICMPYTPPVQVHWHQTSYENPTTLVEGFTISTNASDAAIDQFERVFCRNETEYWCHKYDLQGDYDYDNPQDRTLKMQRRLRGSHMVLQDSKPYGEDIWTCQTWKTNEPAEDSSTAVVAEFINELVCANKEPDECFVVHVFNHPTTLWTQTHYEVQVCFIDNPTTPPTPLVY